MMKPGPQALRPRGVGVLPAARVVGRSSAWRPRQAPAPVRAQQQQQQQQQRGAKTAEDMARQAQDFARRTSRSMSDFVKENELDKKAAAAYADASQALRTASMRLDAEYDLQRRLSSIQGRLSETVQDVDQRFSLRRKLRALFEDSKRMAPVWKRRLGEFASTTQGKTTLTFAVVGLLVTGTLFKILNLLWLGFWVAIPLSVYMADKQRRRERDARQQSASSAPSGRGGGGGGTGWDRTGPVVEAEWVSLDDDGPKTK